LIPFLDPESNSWLPLQKPQHFRQYIFAVFIYVAAYLAIAGPSHVFRLNISYSGEISELPDSVAGMAGRFSSTDTYRNLGGISTFDHSLPFHLTSSLPRLMSLPLFLAAMVGMGLLLFERRNRAGVILLLVTIAAFLLPIGYMQRAADRDVLPFLPLLAVCAGYAIERAGMWLSGLLPSHRKARTQAVIVTLLLLMLMVSPVQDVVRHTMLIVQTDTRDLAAEWIEHNIPAGSRLALEGYGPGILSEAITANLASSGSTITQDARPTYNLYDLQQGTMTKGGAFNPDLLMPFLQENEIEYVILSSGYYHRFYNAAMLHHFPEYALQGRAFHDRVARELELLHVITPEWDNTPGPILQIYRVPPDASGDSDPSSVIFEPYPGFNRDFRAIGYDAEALRWPWLKTERWNSITYQ
jgi:hypothetical protein